MATKKKNEPKENKYGIDRWTSNGYGITTISLGPNAPKKTSKKSNTKKRGK